MKKLRGERSLASNRPALKPKDLSGQNAPHREQLRCEGNSTLTVRPAIRSRRKERSRGRGGENRAGRRADLFGPESAEERRTNRAEDDARGGARLAEAASEGEEEEGDYKNENAPSSP